ncbi:hypothetical protein GUITHDRAFT_145490 [Guillardia theta CCMP2712]|uniref:Uncharacterized protein n=1 Tax=Guillardia theta (strain CCMP2712) TaxID=905079 RepID=L1IKG6_GUITC|nr:hypothetical protein GUITHDRAFT_145490 [Guillardia theta CCMP2712]EKX36743.1 hypothetical protein GUITHDRAFT_145490 [Guillardia theta CCMP2712]|eukprot:XP_005823723.1 hypothetical protein GUITHDRAFT_145490 [Guillardia theta CCMP2712]
MLRTGLMIVSIFLLYACSAVCGTAGADPDHVLAGLQVRESRTSVCVAQHANLTVSFCEQEDVSELESLVAVSTSPRVRRILTAELEKLKTFVELLEGSEQTVAAHEVLAASEEVSETGGQHVANHQQTDLPASGEREVTLRSEGSPDPGISRGAKKHSDVADRFVGFLPGWTEVESPRIKVTLMPYGVAECNYYQGQIESCNLEGCHSGRVYPECHKEKKFPKHPIDSESLLPLPPLPPPTVDETKHACGKGFQGQDGDAALLYKRLRKLQRPRDCKRARLMVYYHHVSGLASEVHKLALALSMALMTNRTLVVAESSGWGYADPLVCGNRTVTCHMQELNTWCKEEDAGEESPEVLLGRCCYMNDSLVTYPHRVMRVNQTTIEQHKLTLYYKTVPRRFAWRGLFWWRAQLVSFLFRPKPHMRPSPGPRFRISMHVRHDNTAEADPIPTSSYTSQASVAAAMLRSLDVSLGMERQDNESLREISLFLATDTPETETEVIRYIAAHNAKSAVKIRVFREEGRMRRRGTHSRAHGHEEIVDIFHVISRLVDSDVFIGKFSSGVSRLIAELGCVSGHFKIMPVSVDRRWGTTTP